MGSPQYRQIRELMAGTLREHVYSIPGGKSTVRFGLNHLGGGLMGGAGEKTCKILLILRTGPPYGPKGARLRNG